MIPRGRDRALGWAAGKPQPLVRVDFPFLQPPGGIFSKATQLQPDGSREPGSGFFRSRAPFRHPR